MRKAYSGLVVVLLTVIFILNGCASFRLEKFVTDRLLSTEVPRLKLGVDESNFDELYPDSIGSKGTWVEHGQEAVILLDRTSADWFGAGDETWGYGIWRVTKRRTVVNYGWFLTSVLTLFIPNIVGYPISSQKVYFGLELEVWDSRSKSIRVYTTESAETVYAAALSICRIIRYNIKADYRA